MANSYVEMTNDRGGKGLLQTAYVEIKNPAPESVIRKFAEQVGMDLEELDGLTPAGVFDGNILGKEEVKALVSKLQDAGYDGAILDDIGYGVQIEDKAHIVFNKGKKK